MTAVRIDDRVTALIRAAGPSGAAMGEVHSQRIGIDDLVTVVGASAADQSEVMIHVQGGMFELSSTAAYDGGHFARDGVVCVVIN